MEDHRQGGGVGGGMGGVGHEAEGGHDRTVGRLWSRREAMHWTAGWGMGMLGAAWVPRAWAVVPTPPLVASPAMTEGPFFVDEKLHRRDLRAGTDRPAVVEATPMRLKLGVFELASGEAKPMEGVQVDVWHCDAAGVYSDTDAPMNHERTGGQDWLRGFQRSDGAGQVVFETIVPGWYRGRTPHIHFKIRPPVVEGGRQLEFTSQLFFDHAQLLPIYAAGVYAAHGQPDRSNEQDNIYGQRLADGTVAGELLELRLEARGADGEASEEDSGRDEDGPARGYDTALAILLTREGLTTRRGRGGPGGGPGGGRDGGGPGGPPRRAR